MDRRRFYQGLLTVALVAFLAVLAFQFRPKVESPRPVTLPGSGEGVHGTLTTTGFRYEQEEAGTTAFVLTAQKMTERGGESRELEGPRLTMPGSAGETVLSGAQGFFDPASRTLRVFGDARLVRPDGWTALSSGFRMTPEGELVAEAAVALSRGTLKGTADLMRYDRQSERAYLEGTVRFADASGQRASCSRLELDLAAHTGALWGPVTLESPQGRVVAPGGEIVLGADNAVQEVRLGPSARGEGPAGRFVADRLRLFAGPGGALERLTLEGAVRAEAAGSGEVLETAAVALVPTAAGPWDWSAPGALTVSRGGDRMEAPSGSGAFGGGTPFRAQLPGPVRGDGPSGRWSASKASLVGAVQTFEGDVRGSRPGETLQADRVVLRADGSKVATGHARGSRETRGQEPLRFEADRAVAAPSGYPVTLDGSVRITRQGATLESPAATVKGPRVAVATGGALGRFKGRRGEETLSARTVAYDGEAARITASGEARGVSQGYTLTAREVVAHLDASGDPARYEAAGEARLDGPAREASGDRLTWEPARQAGTAESRDGRAVVVQKDPYRRAEGPKVAFEGEAVSVSGATASRRGYLESAPPAPRRPDGR